jgi:site-specific DNA-cytosine methylase
LNAAHYGVPQTRKRLILVASRVKAVRKPVPTHAEPSELTPLFETRLPWVGWYAAIEDLIPTLPDSEFAPWQLERLPEEISTLLIAQGKFGENLVTSQEDEPTFTITANTNQTGLRAFIVDGQTNDHGGCVTVPHSHAPMYTLSATMDKRPARAFLVSDDSKMGVADSERPSFTVVSSHRSGNARAFVVSGGNSYTPITDSENFTIGASPSTHLHHRAWLQHGRVVRMTPRALARFQGVPDWYILPNSDALACRVIGNGVPCDLMQAVITANRLAT